MEGATDEATDVVERLERPCVEMEVLRWCWACRGPGAVTLGTGGIALVDVSGEGTELDRGIGSTTSDPNKLGTNDSGRKLPLPIDACLLLVPVDVTAAPVFPPPPPPLNQLFRAEEPLEEALERSAGAVPVLANDPPPEFVPIGSRSIASE